MMDPISGATQSPLAVADIKEMSHMQRHGNEPQASHAKPVVDEYVPKEEYVPTGLYWVGKGEDGSPKVYFDDPGKAPDSAPGSKAESCTTDTDKIGREIEQLKEQKDLLEHRLHSETDDTKIKELERELAKVEGELSQKDTDTYRRQHAVRS